MEETQGGQEMGRWDSQDSADRRKMQREGPLSPEGSP